ncbi:MAG: D-alanine--D-alanine ligase [Clostridia bacterium]|nr:D-alanine--D-alanine ligase [Clostridia bacterium]
MKTKLGLIFGGRSVEHEVSIITAIETISHMDKEKYELIPIYISKQGLMYTGEVLFDLEAYKNMDELMKKVVQINLINDGAKVNIIRYPAKKFGDNIINQIDVAFPVMHGTNGEDGTIAGYLELLNVPYIGCDILSASIGMDKIMMRKVLKESNLPCLDYVAFYSMDYIRNEEKYLQQINENLTYPVIVKAGNLGSSVGIKKANTKEEITEAIEFAMQFSDRIMVENAIVNLKEINCSVIGDMTDAESSECEEPISSDEILSYTDKYLGGSKTEGMAASDKKLPADIPSDTRQQIRTLAVETFKTLGCSGVARVDFLLDEDTNEIYINEINTIPGALSYYLWEATNKPFSKEIDELVELAYKRQRQREKRVYSYDQNILALVSNGKFKGSKGAKCK